MNSMATVDKYLLSHDRYVNIVILQNPTRCCNLSLLCCHLLTFPQLMNEEEPAQPSQEGPAPDAPPPYSSIAAANAG